MNGTPFVFCKETSSICMEHSSSLLLWRDGVSTYGHDPSIYKAYIQHPWKLVSRMRDAINRQDTVRSPPPGPDIHRCQSGSVAARPAHCAGQQRPSYPGVTVIHRLSMFISSRHVEAGRCGACAHQNGRTNWERASVQVRVSRVSNNLGTPTWSTASIACPPYRSNS